MHKKIAEEKKTRGHVDKVKVDFDKLYSVIKEKGLSISKVSLDCGMSDGWLSMCKYNGWMLVPHLKLVCFMLGVEYEDMLCHEVPAPVTSSSCACAFPDKEFREMKTDIAQILDYVRGAWQDIETIKNSINEINQWMELHAESNEKAFKNTNTIKVLCKDIKTAISDNWDVTASGESKTREGVS